MTKYRKPTTNEKTILAMLSKGPSGKGLSHRLQWIRMAKELWGRLAARKAERPYKKPLDRLTVTAYRNTVAWHSNNV